MRERILKSLKIYRQVTAFGYIFWVAVSHRLHAALSQSRETQANAAIQRCALLLSLKGHVLVSQGIRIPWIFVVGLSESQSTTQSSRSAYGLEQSRGSARVPKRCFEHVLRCHVNCWEIVLCTGIKSHSHIRISSCF